MVVRRTFRRWFGPDLWVENFLSVGPELLVGQGIRGLLVDLDGTLKGHYDTQFTAQVTDWIDGILQSGVRLALVSNCKPDYLTPYARASTACPAFREPASRCRSFAAACCGSWNCRRPRGRFWAISCLPTYWRVGWPDCSRSWLRR